MSDAAPMLLRRAVFVLVLGAALSACANESLPGGTASTEASPLSQIVEIHVPLTPPPDPPSGEYPYPWIEDVDEFLAEQEDHGDTHIYDDGEEYEDYYVFSVTGGTEDEMLRLADRVAGLPGVPQGVIAFVAKDDSETFGGGRRVQLPYRSQASS